MTNAFKNALLAISALGTSVVYSADTEPTEALSVQIVSEINVHDRWQPISSSASVDKGVTIDAYFLYWQAYEDGLEYLQSINSTLIDNTHIDIEGRLYDLDFDWNPGVRLDIGYIFPQRQQWELGLGWTHIYSKAHDSCSLSEKSSGEKTLKPIWLPLILGGFAEKASAHWSACYNTLDFSLSRHYFVGKWLAMKPFIGVRGAWIDQDYRVNYLAGHNGLPDITENRFKVDQDFSGGGLIMGTDLQWFAAKNWSILAKVTGGLVYGHFSVDERVKGVVQFAAPVQAFAIFETLHFKNDLNRVVPTVEAKGGVQWQTFFNDDKFLVSVGLFYDLVYWWNQNQFLNYIVLLDESPTANGDSLLIPKRANGGLQYQGISAQARVEF